MKLYEKEKMVTSQGLPVLTATVRTQNSKNGWTFGFSFYSALCYLMGFPPLALQNSFAETLDLCFESGKLLSFWAGTRGAFSRFPVTVSVLIRK